MHFIANTTWLSGIHFCIEVIFCKVINCSRAVRGPGVDDNLSKTALFAKSWTQSEVDGVLFTLV